jgi:hypothetical protein
MNISTEEANESLSVVQVTNERMHRGVASAQARYSSDLLVLWGLIWLAGFALVQFHREGAVYILAGLAAGALVTTVLWIWWRDPKRAVVRSDASRKTFRRVFWFWVLLNPYAFAWILLLAPLDALQVFAFMCTLAMFGFSVLGLWFNSPFVVGLGLLVTAAIVLGYLLSPAWLYLLAALAGGGTMLTTGLYMRIRWR